MCPAGLEPGWTESETAEVNATCNQQMTTQKTEWAEMENWAGVGGAGRWKEARSTNMIIASIFAFFYSWLDGTAREIIANQFADSPRSSILLGLCGVFFPSTLEFSFSWVSVGVSAPQAMQARTPSNFGIAALTAVPLRQRANSSFTV